MQQLFESQDERGKEFRKNIWQYNCANSFSSLGIELDTSVLHGNGPYCFRIHGELRHQMGSLLVEEDGVGSYA